MPNQITPSRPSPVITLKSKSRTKFILTCIIIAILLIGFGALMMYFLLSTHPFSTQSSTTPITTDTPIFITPPTSTSTLTPTSTPTFVLPTGDASSPTPKPTPMFEDRLENGIDQRWQQYGYWIASNGKPILMTGDSTDNGYSAFYDNGGLIVTGTDNLDNYIIEMDFANVIDNGFEILLSFQNEQNFKRIYFISNKTTSRVDRFEFVKNGKEITIIPESRRGFRQVAEGMNHLIIEIRGKTIKLRINNELIYDYSSLPESLAGTMGITTYKYNATPFFDNFALYKLP